MHLKRGFFNRNTNIVAQELLGKTIVVKEENGRISKAIITETEAYHGLDDRASHASRRKTERNKIMFDKAGLVYVYLVYGTHYCLNFVTMREGFPAAVLIRSIAIPVETHCNVSLQSGKILGIKINKMNFISIEGPGRVCKYLGIDKTFYGEDLAKSKRIWVEFIEVNGYSPNYDIIKSKRIGVDYAGECKEWEWNYKINIK